MILINGKEYKQRFFPDGTPNMTDTYIQEQDDGRDVIITWKFENIGEHTIIGFLTSFIQDILRAEVILDVHYFPNGRMDRVKRPTYEVHTLKYFTKEINARGYKKVIVRDVHSPVTMTLLERAQELNIKETIYQLAEQLDVDYLFFPDKGAYERYQYLIMRTPFFGEKTREWETGKITGYEVKNPYNVPFEKYQNASILILDDISSYGGTFHHASLALKEIGFGDIYLYVTHAENSILNGELIKAGNVKHIYTTNSLFSGEHELITIIK